jgi:hypothetical protein
MRSSSTVRACRGLTGTLAAGGHDLYDAHGLTLPDRFGDLNLRGAHVRWTFRFLAVLSTVLGALDE